jgi:hypothetical protein
MFYTSSYLGTPHSSILPSFPSIIHLYSCPLPFFILPSPTGLLPIIVLLFLMFLIFSSSACSSLIYSIFFLFTLPICLLCILFNFIVFFYWSLFSPLSLPLLLCFPTFFLFPAGPIAFLLLLPASYLGIRANVL